MNWKFEWPSLVRTELLRRSPGQGELLPDAFLALACGFTLLERIVYVVGDGIPRWRRLIVPTDTG